MDDIVRNLEQAWTAERDKPVEDALAYRLTHQPLETCLAVSCSLRRPDRQTHKPTIERQAARRTEARWPWATRRDREGEREAEQTETRDRGSSATQSSWKLVCWSWISGMGIGLHCNCKKESELLTSRLYLIVFICVLSSGLGRL